MRWVQYALSGKFAFRVDHRYAPGMEREQVPAATKEPHGENVKAPTLCPILSFVAGHGGVILLPAAYNSLFALETAISEDCNSLVL
jgi:hypothetical protein